MSNYQQGTLRLLLGMYIMLLAAFGYWLYMLVDVIYTGLLVRLGG